MKIIKNLRIWILLIILLVSAFSTNIVSSENIVSSNIDGLSYKQEIIVSIDTSLDISKFQPIDLRIDFENNCWAEDENTHSVRIGFEKDGSSTEIDSQIYDLDYEDDSHISSCSIVFLIPEEADGSEKYYVYYDSEKTEGPDYEDHVTIEDTHYFYEPISGQTIFFDYYGIRQDEEVIYAIVQTGELLGNPVSFAAAKFKAGSKVVETYNIDQLVDFDLRYGIDEEPGYIGTSWANDVKKTILVDGNIMTRVRLEGISTRGDIKTDNIYTYYYSPTDVKRMMVKCHHEILKDIDIDDPSTLDGTLAGITSIKSRSATIDKMNVGEILPDLIVYDEDESIKEYSVPSNPVSTEREHVLTTEDDIDLGSHAWACLSDISSDRCHGIVFESNAGFNNDENDGLQIKAYTKQNIDLPGLEADTGNIYITRNAYENGEHDTNLEKDQIFDYNTMYISTENQGYDRIDSESTIYQELIKDVPIFHENATDGEVVEEERYTLSTSVHLAPSFPLGSLLSAASGKNLPYIYAELYKDNSFKSSGSVGRLSLGSIDLDLEGKKIFQKIKTVVGLFDWKNASFFKKIEFSDLVEGRYLVKIFRENPFFGDERKYIGFGIVDLDKDSDLRIFCKPQGKLNINIKDQNDDAIEDVKFQLLKDDDVIFESKSDENGTAKIYAPISPRKPYLLRLIYKGFIIEEKNVKLGVLQNIRPLSQNFEVELYDLVVKVKDKWYLTPEVDVNPKMTSLSMYETNTIKSEKTSGGEYVFRNIPVSEYQLILKYKSFELVKNLDISDDSIIDILFPAEYKTEISVFNDMGEKIDSYEITISRRNKRERINLDSGLASFMVPPGIYELTIESKNDVIARQKIDVKSDKIIDIVSTEQSGFHTNIMFIGIIVFIIGIIFLIWKRDHNIFLRIFVIALLIMSVVSPWWMLNGEKNTTETVTKTMLVPAKIITITESDDAIGGSISSIPEELTMILGLLSILLVLSIAIIAISLLTKDRFIKTTKGLSIVTMIVIILVLGLFYLAMSMVAEVGVGSVVGSGEIDTTIPGIAENIMINCSWGPSTGFYLGLISIILIVLIPIINRFKK